MDSWIKAGPAARFARLGPDTRIQAGCVFDLPERISIGQHVFLQAPCMLRVIADNRRATAIEIGDGCQINPGLIIIAKNKVTLGSNVLIGPHVRISDQEEMTLDPATGLLLPSPQQLVQDQQTGMAEEPRSTDRRHMRTEEAQGSIDETQADTAESQVVIGDGAWIGANAMVLGNVRVGAGSVVKPNSIVVTDVPDYCVAAGAPAVIVEIYDAASGQWLPAANSEQRQAKEPETVPGRQPLLSICIPTFNRASYLAQCLESILSQVGNNEMVEVIVSDNASTDQTSQIAHSYAARYANMRVVRNEHNMGADPNILTVIKLARGKFVKWQGDDDFSVEGTLPYLLHILHNHGECGVVQIFVINNDGRVWSGNGMSSYLEATSIYATFITSTILRREDLERVEEADLFLSSSLNQLYLQYAVLEKNPRFCIVNNNMFTYADLSSDEYNFGEVFLRSYQLILLSFVGRGLTQEDIAREKRQTLFGYAIPKLSRIIGEKRVADTDHFLNIYTELYKDEPYYEEGLAAIASIIQP
ncbi:MAG: hypothetical protein K0R57_3072 [Paenibacillaceae bacterium]|nr:hypothetical protein [Paenibacillaceae bacterium]